MVRSRLSGCCLVLILALSAVAVSCGGGAATDPGPAPPPRIPPPPPPISVSVSPLTAAVVAITQSQQFSATLNNDLNGKGVIWAVDDVPGGSSSTGTISVTGLYLPPAIAGTHTVTATSVGDATKSAAASIAVTDLAGVLTYHNDLTREGVNSSEYALTATSVNQATFGKLFACQVDGAEYTEPLWVPGITVNGSVHNMIFVATQHDSLYALDADASPCLQLWHANLIDSAHGGTTGETSVCWNDVGSGDQDIQPEIGVVGTPVIDPATLTLYVVSKSEIGGCDSGTPRVFHQRLHAIDLTTGNEKFSAPIDLSASVSGTGDGSSGGTLKFNLRTHNQRSALALVNGVVYLCWASHEDTWPYHGWLLGYSASNVQQQVGIFNTSPNGRLAGIWMAGGAPAADGLGNLYLTTGNGTFDADQTTSPNNDYGDSFIKIGISAGLSPLDYFTPDDQLFLSQDDIDLGSGGVVLLPDQNQGPVLHLLVGGGKEGIIYVVDRDNMGKYLQSTNGQIVQSFPANNGNFSTPAFWENNLYIAGAEHGKTDNLRSYTFSPATGLFTTSASSVSSHSFPFPGATPAISSSGNSNGIVWAVDSSCFGAPSPCGITPLPAVLYAYDATDLSRELWDSSQAGLRDQAGPAVKFTVPTVANGKVYIGTRSEVDVYGLLP
ncbi:MAG TPA: hypothetical protein VHV29_08590 [Terriglobales bacterium]|nr:hypothetical protein [Terriglobales bacterium]